jgi:hypothetical protein
VRAFGIGFVLAVIASSAFAQSSTDPNSGTTSQSELRRPGGSHHSTSSGQEGAGRSERAGRNERAGDRAEMSSERGATRTRG